MRAFLHVHMHCVFILGAVMRTCVCCVCVVAANVTTVFCDRDWMCLFAACGVCRCGVQCIVLPPRVSDIDDLRLRDVRPLCSSSRST